jgi:hypothetical protein
MSPTPEVVSNFVERARAFEGTPIQRLLHRQRLARRMAKEHQHRFSSDQLICADAGTGALTSELELRVVARTRELQAENDRLTRLVAESDILLVGIDHSRKSRLAMAATLLGMHARNQTNRSGRSLRRRGAVLRRWLRSMTC